ncbi:uncharacterized protein LOC129612277 [Condylostylus longicornis]|uniref:uncharacterized protein LOC129612277 n=1 Tax=Condylostylus longicornis TaxID=2530218 RepID=UPI00244DA19A|nr:uncharacterized protein LOC129612277 [Condylostylus longicornis]
MFRKLIIFFILSLIAIILIAPAAENAVILTKRDAEDSSEETDRICETFQTPCGWAVYKPFKRKIEYFMRNACKCSPGLKCIRTDDDASVSAFVYKCRNKTTSSTVAPDINTGTTITTTLSPEKDIS